MTSSLRAILTLLVLLAASLPLFGHLVVDGDANIYFIDVFKNKLLKVDAEGHVSMLADLRDAER